MAKTMFGIPGVNDKSSSGGAIAPKGTNAPVETSPQKQEPKKDDKAPMAKPGMAKPGMAKPGMAKPGMAKPMPAQGANMPAQQPAPAPASTAASHQPSSANKTMFGMPAMNIPMPGAKGAPAAQPATPAAPAAAQTPAPASPGAETKDDAFKATMLGVPAVDQAALDKAKQQHAQAAQPQAAKLEESAFNTEPAPPIAPSSLDNMLNDDEPKQESAPAAEPALAPEPAAAVQPTVGQNIQQASPAAQGPSTGTIIGLIAGCVVFISVAFYLVWNFILN